MSKKKDMPKGGRPKEYKGGQLSVRLTQELREDLEGAAKALDMSVADLVRAIILNWFDYEMGKMTDEQRITVGPLYHYDRASITKDTYQKFMVLAADAQRRLATTHFLEKTEKEKGKSKTPNLKEDK
jgi:hypothetical protein